MLKVPSKSISYSFSSTIFKYTPLQNSATGKIDGKLAYIVVNYPVL